MSAPKHLEAYMLMTYVSKDRSVVEVLWNSRDGVTPFIIGSKDEKHELSHVDWGKDKFLPFYRPAVGSRVFVDLTLEAARAYRRAYVEKYWDLEVYGEKMSGRTDLWKTPEEAVEYLAGKDFDNNGFPGTAPDIVVVDGRLREVFVERSEALMKKMGITGRFA